MKLTQVPKQPASGEPKTKDQPLIDAPQDELSDDEMEQVSGGGDGVTPGWTNP